MEKRCVICNKKLIVPAWTVCDNSECEREIRRRSAIKRGLISGRTNQEASDYRFANGLLKRDKKGRILPESQVVDKNLA